MGASHPPWEENSAGWLATASRRIEWRESLTRWLLCNAAAFNHPTLRIQLDDRRSFNSSSEFVRANARYFGGGMKIAPEAKLNDGLLDV